MRQCGRCHKPDAPRFGPSDCTCPQSKVLHDDDPSPFKHAPECNAVEHEVALFPVRLAASDLTWEKKLPAKWVAQGWMLKQNGGRWYRMKMLCRDCIGIEESVQERSREYQEACKATRSAANMTYAQMLANQ